jgi:hypothetical protein
MSSIDHWTNSKNQHLNVLDTPLNLFQRCHFEIYGHWGSSKDLVGIISKMHSMQKIRPVSPFEI